MPNIEKLSAPRYEWRMATNTSNRAAIDAINGIVDGYPIVFNEQTTIGNYFTEEIDPNALDDADLSDIKFLVNHDDGMIPLARHRRGKRSTMDIEIDGRGLFIKTHLDVENNSTARELCSAVKRGDIEDMSFAFGVVVEGEEWSDLDKEIPHRKITKISKVYEVSAVNDGAYPQTEINARSEATLDNAKRTLDNVRAAALDNEKRANATQDALRLAKQKFIFSEEAKRL
jgi:hypothetical protein